MRAQHRVVRTPSEVSDDRAGLLPVADEGVDVALDPGQAAAHEFSRPFGGPQREFRQVLPLKEEHRRIPVRGLRRRGSRQVAQGVRVGLTRHSPLVRHFVRNGLGQCGCGQVAHHERLARPGDMDSGDSEVADDGKDEKALRRPVGTNQPLVQIVAFLDCSPPLFEACDVRPDLPGDSLFVEDVRPFHERLGHFGDLGDGRLATGGNPETFLETGACVVESPQQVEEGQQDPCIRPEAGKSGHPRGPFAARADRLDDVADDQRDQQQLGHRDRNHPRRKRHQSRKLGERTGTEQALGELRPSGQPAPRQPACDPECHGDDPRSHPGRTVFGRHGGEGAGSTDAV